MHLTYIHGIGLYSSKKICKKLNISESTRVNQLSEEQVLKIREYIDSNHKVEGDLRRDISVNIKRLVDLATYRGSRHKKNYQLEVKELIVMQEQEKVKLLQ